MTSYELATYKRIILCCDGTWMDSDRGSNERPANVARIARAIASSSLDRDKKVVKQIVYYHPGLGSGDMPLQRAIRGAIGCGLERDLSQIYGFISNNYEQGDEIFFFGFSRGAFAVRLVAGLICDVGVLSAIQMSSFPELLKAYLANYEGPFRKTTWYRDNQTKLGLVSATVKVVGVFETVGELGVPEWWFVKWARHWGMRINKQYQFHNTFVSKNIEYAFHALAIDERRLGFQPTMWYQTVGGPSKELKQCWFPGVHANLGGHSELYEKRSDHGQIGFVCLGWMIDSVSNMLTFEEDSIKTLLDEHRHALNSNASSNGWGSGPIISVFAGWMGKLFWLLGRKTRTPGQYHNHALDQAAGQTYEYFHPVVRYRKLKVPKYSPKALEGFEPEYGGASGWKWTKASSWSIPEYSMTAEKKMNVAYIDNRRKVTGYGSMESFSRLICPENVLAWLDKEIGTDDQGPTDQNGEGTGLQCCGTTAGRGIAGQDMSMST